MSTRGQRNNILTYDEKYFALQNYFEKGLTIQDLRDTLNVGESTVRDWLKRIDNDFANIERLKRAKRVIPANKTITAIPEEIKEEILKLLKTHPEMGPLKVKQYFFRHHQILLSEKRIYFFLKEQGNIEKRNEPRKRNLSHDRRIENEKPLGAVQQDQLTVRHSGGAKKVGN